MCKLPVGDSAGGVPGFQTGCHQIVKTLDHEGEVVVSRHIRGCAEGSGRAPSNPATGLLSPTAG